VLVLYSTGTTHLTHSIWIVHGPKEHFILAFFTSVAWLLSLRYRHSCLSSKLVLVTARHEVLRSPRGTQRLVSGGVTKVLDRSIFWYKKEVCHYRRICVVPSSKSKSKAGRLCTLSPKGNPQQNPANQQPRAADTPFFRKWIEIDQSDGSDRSLLQGRLAI
jgi:hypothetical protein